MKQKPKRKRSVIVRLIVLGFSIYMITMLAGLVNEYVELKTELEALQSKKNSLQLDVDELKSLLESDSHAAIIEKAARERLGFVYSDEEIYIDISGN